MLALMDDKNREADRRFVIALQIIHASQGNMNTIARAMADPSNSCLEGFAEIQQAYLDMDLIKYRAEFFVLEADMRTNVKAIIRGGIMRDILTEMERMGVKDAIKIASKAATNLSDDTARVRKTA